LLLTTFLIAALILGLSRQRNWRWGALAVITLGTGLWVFEGRVDFIGLLLPFTLMGLAFLIVTSSQRHRGIGIAAHAGFLVTMAAALLHAWPGITNLVWLDGVSIGSSSMLFTQYVNFDKAWVGMALLWMATCWPGEPKPSPITAKQAIGWMSFIGAATLTLAWSAGLLSIDIDASKLSPFVYFAPVNLVLTCMVEEALFRHYIQGGLTQWVKHRHAQWIALGAASVIFGLAHFAGGPGVVVAASVIGLGYGLVYLRFGILGATLAHFLFNAVHFLFFSYPGP
jgi:hypothetical protein